MNGDDPKVPALVGNGGDQGEEDRGQQEALSLGRGLTARDLRREADESDHDRNERFKGHFDRIGIGALYITSVAVFLAALFWFWHLVTPWKFLNDDQLAHLQNLLTGGILVSVATSYMKKRLG